MFVFRKHRFVIRMVSAIVLCLFLWTDSVKGQSFAVSPTVVPQYLDSLHLSNHLGNVKEVFKQGDSSALTVIQIQDSHANYEAQVHISEIMNQILKSPSFENMDSVLVAVEAASGPLDPEPVFGTFNPKVQSIINHEFLKEGKMSGIESFVLNSKKEVQLVGIEDPELYKENLTLFKQAHQIKQAFLNQLEETKSELNQIQSRVYPHPFFKLVELEKGYESGSLSFKEYVTQLMEIAKASELNQNSLQINYPQIEQTLNIFELENKIDFKRVEKERRLFFKELETRLVREDQRLFVEKSLFFRLGQLSPFQFYFFLRDLVQTTYRSPEAVQERYPHLFNYIETVDIHAGIEGTLLYEEVKSLSKELKKEWLAEISLMELDQFDAMLSLLTKLASLEMTREELKQLSQIKGDWNLKKWSESLTEIVWEKPELKNKIQQLENELRELSQFMSQLSIFESFYQVALKRDQAMSQNLLALAQEKKADLVFLVSGGFHTEGLNKIFEKQDVSYAVVSPRMVQHDSNPYLRQMLQLRTPFEEALLRSGNRLGIELLSAANLMTEQAVQNRLLVAVEKLVLESSLEVAFDSSLEQASATISFLLSEQEIGSAQLIELKRDRVNQIVYGLIQVNDEVFTFFLSNQPLSKKLEAEVKKGKRFSVDSGTLYLVSGDIRSKLFEEKGDRSWVRQRGRQRSLPVPTSGVGKYKAAPTLENFPDRTLLNDSQKEILGLAMSDLLKSLNKSLRAVPEEYQRYAELLYSKDPEKQVRYSVVPASSIGSAAVTLPGEVVFEDVWLENIGKSEQLGQVALLQVFLRGELPHLESGESLEDPDKRFDEEVRATQDQFIEYLSLTEEKKEAIKTYYAALREHPNTRDKLPHTNLGKFVTLIETIQSEHATEVVSTWASMTRNQKLKLVFSYAEEFVIEEFPELSAGLVSSLTLAKNLVRVNPFLDLEMGKDYNFVIKPNGSIIAVQKGNVAPLPNEVIVPFKLEIRAGNAIAFAISRRKIEGLSKRGNATFRESIKVLNKIRKKPRSLRGVGKILQSMTTIDKLIEALLAFPTQTEEEQDAFFKRVESFSKKSYGKVPEPYYELIRQALLIMVKKTTPLTSELGVRSINLIRSLELTQRDRELVENRLMPVVQEEMMGHYLGASETGELEQGDVFQVGKNNFYLVLSIGLSRVRLIEYYVDDEQKKTRLNIVDRYLEPEGHLRIGTQNGNGYLIQALGNQDGIFSEHAEIRRSKGGLIVSSLQEGAQTAVYSAVNQALDESKTALDVFEKQLQKLFPKLFPPPPPVANVDLAPMGEATMNGVLYDYPKNAIVFDGMPKEDYVPSGVWVQWTEGKDDIPVQGWKLHIAATLKNNVGQDQEVMEVATEYLRSRGAEHKVHRVDRIMDHSISEKKRQNGLRQSIKMITIYPNNREEAIQYAAELELLLQQLDIGEEPKQIQGEKRLLKNGFVHFRYGRMRGGSDYLVNPNDSNDRHYDDREVYFSPSWDPDIQAEALVRYEELKEAKSSGSQIVSESRILSKSGELDFNDMEQKVLIAKRMETQLNERKQTLSLLKQSNRESVLKEIESIERSILDLEKKINKIKSKWMEEVSDKDWLEENLKQVQVFREMLITQAGNGTAYMKLAVDGNGRIVDIQQPSHAFIAGAQTNINLGSYSLVHMAIKFYPKGEEWFFRNGDNPKITLLFEKMLERLNAPLAAIDLEGSAILELEPEEKPLTFDEVFNQHVVEYWKDLKTLSLQDDSLRPNLEVVLKRFTTVFNQSPNFFKYLLETHFDSEFVREYEQERVQQQAEYGQTDLALSQAMQRFIENYLRVVLSVEAGRPRDGLIDPMDVMHVRKFFYRIFGNFKDESFNAQEINPKNIYLFNEGHEEKAGSSDSEEMVIYGAHELYSYSRGASRYFIKVRYKGAILVLMRSASHQIWRRVEVMTPGWMAKPLAEHALDLNESLNERLDELIVNKGRAITPVKLADVDELSEMMDEAGILVGLGNFEERGLPLERYNVFGGLGRVWDMAKSYPELDHGFAKKWFSQSLAKLRAWEAGQKAVEGAAYFLDALPKKAVFFGSEEIPVGATMEYVMSPEDKDVEELEKIYRLVDPKTEMIQIGSTLLRFVIQGEKVILIPEDGSDLLLEKVLRPGVYNIGRALKSGKELNDIEISFPDPTISLKHMTLKIESSGSEIRIFAQDLESTNGTFVRPLIGEFELPKQEEPVSPEALEKEIEDETIHAKFFNLRESTLEDPELFKVMVRPDRSLPVELGPLVRNMFQEKIVESEDPFIKKVLLAFVIAVYVRGKPALKKATEILMSDQSVEDMGYELTPEMLVYFSQMRNNEYDLFVKLRNDLVRYHARKLYRADLDEEEYERRINQVVQLNEQLKEISNILSNIELLTSESFKELAGEQSAVTIAVDRWGKILSYQAATQDLSPLIQEKMGSGNVVLLRLLYSKEGIPYSIDIVADTPYQELVLTETVARLNVLSGYEPLNEPEQPEPVVAKRVEELVEVLEEDVPPVEEEVQQPAPISLQALTTAFQNKQYHLVEQHLVSILSDTRTESQYPSYLSAFFENGNEEVQFKMMLLVMLSDFSLLQKLEFDLALPEEGIEGFEVTPLFLKQWTLLIEATLLNVVNGLDQPEQFKVLFTQKVETIGSEYIKDRDGREQLLKNLTRFKPLIALFKQKGWLGGSSFMLLNEIDPHDLENSFVNVAHRASQLFALTPFAASILKSVENPVESLTLSSQDLMDQNEPAPLPQEPAKEEPDDSDEGPVITLASILTAPIDTETAAASDEVVGTDPANPDDGPVVVFSESDDELMAEKGVSPDQAQVEEGVPDDLVVETEDGEEMPAMVVDEEDLVPVKDPEPEFKIVDGERIYLDDKNILAVFFPDAWLAKKWSADSEPLELVDSDDDLPAAPVATDDSMEGAYPQHRDLPDLDLSDSDTGSGEGEEQPRSQLEDSGGFDGEELIDEEPVEAEPEPIVRRDRDSRWPLIASIIIVAGLIAFFGYLYFSSRKSEDQSKAPVTAPETPEVAATTPSTPTEVASKDGKDKTDTVVTRQPERATTQPTQPETNTQPETRTQPTTTKPVVTPRVAKVEDFLETNLNALDPIRAASEAQFAFALKKRFETFFPLYSRIRQNPETEFVALKERLQARLQTARASSDTNALKIAQFENEVEFAQFEYFLEKIRFVRHYAGDTYLRRNRGVDPTQDPKLVPVLRFLGQVKRVSESGSYRTLAEPLNVVFTLDATVQSSTAFQAFLTKLRYTTVLINTLGNEAAKVRLYHLHRAVYASSFRSGSTFTPNLSQNQFQLILTRSSSETSAILPFFRNLSELDQDGKRSLRRRTVGVIEDLDLLLRINELSNWINANAVRMLETTRDTFRSFLPRLPESSRNKVNEGDGHGSLVPVIIPKGSDGRLAALKRSLNQILENYRTDDGFEKLQQLLQPVVSRLPAEGSLENRLSDEVIDLLMGGKYSELTLSVLSLEELSELTESSNGTSYEDQQVWEGFLKQKETVETELKNAYERFNDVRLVIFRLDEAHATEAQLQLLKAITPLANAFEISTPSVQTYSMGQGIRVEIGAQDSFDMSLKLEGLIRLLQESPHRLIPPVRSIDRLAPPVSLRAVESAA